MSIRTFWQLLLKILGLSMIKNCLSIIADISILQFSVEEDTLFYYCMFLLPIVFNIIIYFLVMYFLIMKSAWIIDTLKLDKHFTDEKIDFNIRPQTVLQIAVIIFGGLIFVQGLPPFFKHMTDFYQHRFIISTTPNFPWIIFFFVKILSGYFMMTNSNAIIHFIEKQTKVASEE